MTTRVSLFESPLFLGFDHFEQTFDKLKKTANGYPPYNIEQLGKNGYRISLAVAGFTMEDLFIELEQNQLRIRGKKQPSDSEHIFLHNGIAMRQFQRQFVLADGVEVMDAHLSYGLLHIDMQRIEPENKAQTIPIREEKEALDMKKS